MSGTNHPQLGSLPWHIYAGAHYEICTRNGDGVALVYRNDKLDEQAIARLLVAAPRLLEALQTLLAKAEQLIYRPAIDDSRQVDVHTRELRDVLKSARAAIAATEPQQEKTT